jgi:hypothetical protein
LAILAPSTGFPLGSAEYAEAHGKPTSSKANDMVMSALSRAFPRRVIIVSPPNGVAGIRQPVPRAL